MNNHYTPVIRMLLQYSFWMFFFSVNRLVFLIYQFDSTGDVTAIEILTSFWKGWYMDSSMACYIIGLPFLFLSIQQFYNKSWMDKAIKIYSLLVVLVISFLVSSELELFVEWGTKLNYKAIRYLEHPSEVVGIASNKVLFISLTSIVLQFLIAYLVYQKMIMKKKLAIDFPFWKKIGFILIVPVLIVLGIRGGIQQVPIHQSDVYYSSNNVLNNAAVNSTWNVIHSLLKNKKYLSNNPYQYYATKDAQETVSQLYNYSKDSTANILNSERPNIMLLLLEGWSSDMIEPLGGYPEITPKFNALANEGLLFTNIYASGMRSNQGMAATLSAFPSQPTTVLTDQPSKYPKVPVLNQQLSKVGYETFYGFGGQLSYGNIKSYLMHAGFDKIIEGKDFSSDIPRAKLGVHDEYFYPRIAKELGQLKEPFFATAFTLSSHAPYDIPIEKDIDINGFETEYTNSVHYADQCLGHFFETIKKESWYSNTLFVIVSDHGHSSPKQRGYYTANYRKIPLLFYGEVLEESFRGMKMGNIGSQIDIASTLLSQLKIDDSPFKWSKNLLNPESPEFAYFAFNDGVGWIEKGNHFSYHHGLQLYFDELYHPINKKENIIKNGKSYLQIVFEEYLDL